MLASPSGAANVTGTISDLRFVVTPTFKDGNTSNRTLGVGKRDWQR
jgi:hypothetical protein